MKSRLDIADHSETNFLQTKGKEEQKTRKRKRSVLSKKGKEGKRLYGMEKAISVTANKTLSNNEDEPVLSKTIERILATNINTDASIEKKQRDIKQLLHIKRTLDRFINSLKYSEDATSKTTKKTENRAVNDDMPKVYLCGICKIHFITLEVAKKHFEDHSCFKVSSIKCSQCELLFASHDILNHIEIHHTNKCNAMEVIKIVPDDEENHLKTIFDAIHNPQTVKPQTTSHKNTQSSPNRSCSPLKKIETQKRTAVIERGNGANNIVLRRTENGAWTVTKNLHKSPTDVEKELDISNEDIGANIITNEMKTVLHKCRECNVHFLALSTCMKHIYSHKKLDRTESIECNECGLQFKYRSLDLHRKTQHDGSVKFDNVEIIEHSPKSLARRNQLNSYSQNKCLPVNLEIIEKRDFVSKDRYPTGVDLKIFKCHDCSVCFLKLNTFRAHMNKRCPLDKNVWKECCYCLLRFKYRSLSKHIKTHHSKTCNLDDVVIEELMPNSKLVHKSYRYKISKNDTPKTPVDPNLSITSTDIVNFNLSNNFTDNDTSISPVEQNLPMTSTDIANFNLSNNFTENDTSISPVEQNLPMTSTDIVNFNLSNKLTENDTPRIPVELKLPRTSTDELNLKVVDKITEKHTSTTEIVEQNVSMTSADIVNCNPGDNLCQNDELDAISTRSDMLSSDRSEVDFRGFPAENIASKINESSKEVVNVVIYKCTLCDNCYLDFETFLEHYWLHEGKEQNKNKEQHLIKTTRKVSKFKKSRRKRFKQKKIFKNVVPNKYGKNINRIKRDCVTKELFVKLTRIDITEPLKKYKENLARRNDITKNVMVQIPDDISLQYDKEIVEDLKRTEETGAVSPSKNDCSEAANCASQDIIVESNREDSTHSNLIAEETSNAYKVTPAKIRNRRGPIEEDVKPNIPINAVKIESLQNSECQIVLKHERVMKHDYETNIISVEIIGIDDTDSECDTVDNCGKADDVCESGLNNSCKDVTKRRLIDTLFFENSDI